MMSNEVYEPIVKKLSRLFELGMRRENVFLLPDRKLNVARGAKNYEDYMPVFLLECREITEVLETVGKPLHIVVDQIKEKYGILRFYYHFEDAEPGRDGVPQKIAQIVEKYEDKSESVCEICGREGTLRTDLRWIQTLCDACYSKCIGRKRYV